MDLDTFKILEFNEKHFMYKVEVDQKKEYWAPSQVERIVAIMIRLKLKNILGHTKLYNIATIKSIFDDIINEYEYRKLN